MSIPRLGVNIDHVATVRAAIFSLPLREGAIRLRIAQADRGRGVSPYTPSPKCLLLRSIHLPPPARGGGIGMVLDG